LPYSQLSLGGVGILRTSLDARNQHCWRTEDNNNCSEFIWLPVPGVLIG